MEDFYQRKNHGFLRKYFLFLDGRIILLKGEHNGEQYANFYQDQAPFFHNRLFQLLKQMKLDNRQLCRKSYNREL